MEIYNCHQFKNFTKVDRKTIIAYNLATFCNLIHTTRHLGIRENDTLFAFEIRSDKRELDDERTRIRQMLERSTKPMTQLAVGDYVDMIDAKNNWVTGIVKEISNDSKTVHVATLTSADEVWSTTQAVNSRKLSPFMTKTPKNPVECKNVAYLIECFHRKKNKNNGRMEHFGFPVVVAVPDWFTVREMVLLIYRQVQRFINFDHLNSRSSAPAVGTTEKKSLPKMATQNGSARNTPADKYTPRKGTDCGPNIEAHLHDDDTHNKTFANWDENQGNQFIASGSNGKAIDSALKTPAKYSALGGSQLLDSQKVKDVSGTQSKMSGSGPLRDDFWYVSTEGALPFTFRALEGGGMYYDCAICGKEANNLQVQTPKGACKGCQIPLEGTPLSMWQKFSGAHRFVISLDWHDLYGLNVNVLAPESHPS